jgi:hypothetical protein
MGFVLYSSKTGFGEDRNFARDNILPSPAVDEPRVSPFRRACANGGAGLALAIHLRGVRGLQILILRRLGAFPFTG